MERDVFSRSFCFDHESGDVLYPYRMRNRSTGRYAFRVSAERVVHGRQQEVEEAEMLRLVLEHNYIVRMSTLDRERDGGYRPNRPSIVAVRRSGC